MPSGRVRPGERLGYVERLRQRDLWPLTSIRYDRGDPVATPYLVVPVAPNDNGVRPLAGDTALHNPNVEILDGTGTPVTQPVKGTPYTLRCTIRNLGAISAYAGLAEFYVATPSFFDQAAVTFRASMRAAGYAGFVALPGTDSVIDCPGFWTPASDQEAASSVLVQVYDPFTDPLSYPFDAREDRHVGRRDIAPVVQNGSFENGTDPGVFTTVNPGDTNIDNWSVDSGNVDYIGTYWQAADGNRSIDMNGLTAGSISQTVPTVAGAVYTVSFDLSGNPYSASSVGVDPSLASPSNKQLSVSATGNPAQIYSFDTSVEGNTRSDMKWKPELYTFTATGSSTTLTFASAIKGAFGPALDNVVVN